MDSQRTTGLFIALSSRSEIIAPGGVDSAIDIKMASQMCWKNCGPASAAHFPVNCALQQNFARVPRATAAQNSDHYRLDNAHLCVISRRKAGFTGLALLSIANSGQMVLKLHDKIESRFLDFGQLLPAQAGGCCQQNKSPLGETS